MQALLHVRQKEERLGSHHVSPGLDLALPVPQSGQGRDDDVRAQHPQELRLEGQRGDGLRRLAQALQPSWRTVTRLLRLCLLMQADTTDCRSPLGGLVEERLIHPMPPSNGLQAEDAEQVWLHKKHLRIMAMDRSAAA